MTFATAVGTAWAADVTVEMQPSSHRVQVGQPPTFRATADAGSSPVFLIVSRSKAVRQDLGGIIDNSGKVWMTSMRRSGARWTAKPGRHQFKGYWLNTPGTYYWQAFYIKCASKQQKRACYHGSSIQTLQVTS